MSSLTQWLDNFAHSPGFGGIAAVVAASVAYRFAQKTAELQRTIATDDRNQQDETAARDRWWDQAKWAFDRLDNSTTQASALEAFDALLDRVGNDEAERAFVRAALRPGLQAPGKMPLPWKLRGLLGFRLVRPLGQTRKTPVHQGKETA